MRQPDILHVMVDRILAADPNISIAVVDRVLFDMRQTWGGQRIRIPRLDAVDERPRLRVHRLRGGVVE